MRQLILASVMILATNTATARSAERAARSVTIGSISYLETYGPTEKVRIFRNQTASIEVKGKLLDLSTGVEVKTSSGATVDFFSRISKRTGGDNTSIVIDISVPADAALGTYQVLIHYAIEASGPDRFLVQVFDRGTVTSLRLVEPPNFAGKYVTGQTYTLVVGGAHLENAAILTARIGSGVTGTAIGAGTSAEKRFAVQFRDAGNFSFQALDLYDQNLPTAPPVSCPAQCYEGTPILSIATIDMPNVTSVSSRTPAPGSTVTLSGTGLTGTAFTIVLTGRVRYGSLGERRTFSTTVAGSSLSFVADANVRQDSLALEFRNTGAANGTTIFRLPLPTIAVQNNPPGALNLDIDSLRSPQSSVQRKILLAGPHTLHGHFLAAYPLLSFTLAASSPTIPTSGINPGTLSPSLPSSPPTQPQMRFVTSLDVKTAKYDQNARSGNGFGDDIVTFDMPNLPDTMTSDFKVTTPAGTATIPGILFIPPPTIASIRRRLATGATVDVTDGKLVKGATYELAGKALILTNENLVLRAATVRLNGTAIPTANASAAPGTPLVFTLPATATSGALTVENVAGVSPGIGITVLDAAAPVAIAGFQLTPASVVGGQPLSATVAVNAAVPAGASIGTLFFSQQSTVPNVISLPATRAITANPVTFNISTRVTRVPITSTVTVASVDQSATAPNVATATVTVVPPSPTAITLNNAAVVGGAPVTATIQMTGAATLADSITIALTNSDPTTATVPASITLNGNSATVQIATQVVPNVRTVTISAASGGQTRSATLTVNPPTVSTVTPGSASAIGPATVPVTVTLSAATPAPLTVAVACTGEGLTCPATMAVSGSTGTFNVTVADVPTARTGTITVTANGVSRSGSLELQPLAIQAMTASPATISGGANFSITVQLNRLGTTTLHLSSSDTTLVSIPQTVTLNFNGSQLTQFLTIATRGAPTTSKPVTITATGTHTTALGPATLTKTATVVVAP